MADDDNRLMGSTEVAEMLGVSPATVARAVQSGRLRASEVTPGGHSRFSLSDVRAFRAGGRRRRRPQPVVPEVRDDRDQLSQKLDDAVRRRLGTGLGEEDWRLLLGRLDDLAEAVVRIVVNGGGVLERPSTAGERAVSAPPPAPVSEPEPSVSPAGESEPAPSREDPARPETTSFEDGNSGLTLVVRPIEKFALIETITALLTGVQGVGEIRLRRLQRGVAWFTIRYAGNLPAATVIPRVLSALPAQVVVTGERTFEATLSRAEAPLPATAAGAGSR